MQSEAAKRLLERWDNFNASNANYEEAYNKLAKYARDDWEALRAALSTDAEPVGVRCTGCGSPWTDEDLAYQKSRRPELLSCCPERKMIPVYAAPPAPSVAVKAILAELDNVLVNDERDRETLAKIRTMVSALPAAPAKQEGGK